MVLDDFPVTTKYCLPKQEDAELDDIDQYWYQEHVRESQYFLQIVKGRSEECCGEFRSGLLQILPDRFFPPPISVVQSVSEIMVSENNEKGNFLDLMQRRVLVVSINKHNKYLQIPLNCPSVQSQLQKRICKTCGLYFASQKSATRHAIIHNNVTVSFD